MNHTEFFNILDYVYIAIMLISSIVGFVRGFTKDFFSTCAWFGSGFISIFIAPHLYGILEPYISNDRIMKGTAITIAFVAMLMLLLLLTSFISTRVKATIFAGVDRAAGTLFGLLRGMCILFIFCALILIFEISVDKYTFIKESKLSSIMLLSAEKAMPWFEKIDLIKTVRGKSKLKKIAVPQKKEKLLKEVAIPIKLNETVEKKDGGALKSLRDAIAEKIAQRYYSVSETTGPTKSYMSLSEARQKRRAERKAKLLQKQIRERLNKDDDREAD